MLSSFPLLPALFFILANELKKTGLCIAMLTSNYESRKDSKKRFISKNLHSSFSPKADLTNLTPQSAYPQPGLPVKT